MTPFPFIFFLLAPVFCAVGVWEGAWLNIIAVGGDKRGAIYNGTQADAYILDADLNEGCGDRNLAGTDVLTICMEWGPGRGQLTVANGSTCCFSRFEFSDMVRNVSIDGESYPLWNEVWKRSDCE